MSDVVFDIQTAFNWLLGIVFSVFGWFMRELHMDVKDLKATLPETYARRDDVKDKFDLILTELRDISVKIDRKADKHSGT